MEQSLGNESSSRLNMEARKAAVMARTRLTNEAVLESLKLNPHLGHMADFHWMARAQQTADYELLWPVIEAAQRVCQCFDNGYGQIDNLAVQELAAALDALGLGPEGQSK